MQFIFDLLKIDLKLINYKDILLSLLTAFTVCLLTIPVIIRFAKKFNFLDTPNARKLHTSPMPTLGGIAIFAGMMISLVSWYPVLENSLMHYFFFSVFILFITGIWDDLKNIPARIKFIIEIALSFIIAWSGIRITSFEGLFFIWQLPEIIQYLITILLITGLTNAFNLIDGIDGLAGSLGFMSLIGLGFFLHISGDTFMPMIVFTLAGSLLAFLYFNFSPAKIFMGDTGSLVIGFVIAVSCIRLINFNQSELAPPLSNTLLLSLGLVMIPVFDMIRVIVIRIVQGKSPFTADQNHIHHILLNNGFSHEKVTQKICLVHGVVLLIVYWLQYLKMEYSMLILFVFLILVVEFFKRHKPTIS